MLGIYEKPLSKLDVEGLSVNKVFIVLHAMHFITIVFSFKTDTCTTKLSQWAHDVIMTSYQRGCDVMTSHRRRSDVIMTSCACWDMEPNEYEFYCT